MTTPTTKKAAFDPSKCKVVKNVTLPILKKVDDTPIYITFLSQIYLGKEMAVAEGEAKQEPAHLAEIINLETGEEMQVICNAVMRGGLEETYVDQGYVGKSFKIVQMKVAGKRYKNFSIIQIEV